MKSAAWLALMLAGFWWWRSDPDVEKGNARAVEGKFEDALADFDRAEKVLTDEDQKRQLAFNRGIAQHGAGKLDEARKSFAYAAQSEDPQLRSRAAFNEGNTAQARKDKTGAIDAYIRSLRADPGYEPAKRNLEMLLVEPPPPPDGGNDGNDGGANDGGSDGGGGGGKGDGGSDGGQGPDGGSGDGGDSDNQPPPMDDPQKPQDKPKEPERVTEQDAMKILDAMKDAEKNRPLGRAMLRDNRPRKSSKEW